MRILGIDVGSRRIGLAISDPEEILATPLTVIDQGGDEAALESICQLVHEYNIGRIVVGMPRSLDGSLGKQAVEVQDFIAHLARRCEIPIEMWDERLSTVAAQKMMAEAGTKRSRRKGLTDALAASVILQGYLDRSRAD